MYDMFESVCVYNLRRSFAGLSSHALQARVNEQGNKSPDGRVIPCLPAGREMLADVLYIYILVTPYAQSDVFYTDVI